jgi:hypothetical protein
VDLSVPGDIADMVLDMPAGDRSEAIARCLKVRPSESSRVASKIAAGISYCEDFDGALSYRSQYDHLSTLKARVPNVALGRSTFFVPHDQSQGQESPIHELLALKATFNQAKPESSIYTVPMFPSDETRGMVRECAQESLLGKIEAVKARLATVGSMRDETLRSQIEALEAAKSEARLYQRLLEFHAEDIELAIAETVTTIQEELARRSA